MWWAGSKAHEVYVGTRAVAVYRGDERVSAQSVADFDSALVALREWVEASPQRLRLRVWLSGGLCRPFLVPPVPGIKSATELRRVAGALAPQRTGLNGECRVWIDDGKPARTRVAAALLQSSLDRLLDALGTTGSRRHRVLSIRPWWAELLRSVLHREPQAPAVAVQDCDSLTVLAGHGEGFDIATTLTPVFDAETADAALARAMLSVDVPADKQRLARLMPLREEMAASQADLALSRWVEWAR